MNYFLIIFSDYCEVENNNKKKKTRYVPKAITFYNLHSNIDFINSFNKKKKIISPYWNFDGVAGEHNSICFSFQSLLMRGGQVISLQFHCTMLASVFPCVAVSVHTGSAQDLLLQKYSTSKVQYVF